MKKEELERKCNISAIREKVFIDLEDEYKKDYIIDRDGRAILPVSILENKIIKKLFSDYYKLKNKNEQKLQYIKYTYNVRLKELEDFKSYFIESIIESKSFAELKQFIIDRYGDD